MSKTIKEWRKIYEIIDNHTPFPTKEKGELLCFNSLRNWEDCQNDQKTSHEKENKCSHIDYYQITSKELAVKVDQYNLIKESNNLNIIKEEINEDKDIASANVTDFKNYKMDQRKEEDYFNYIPSKDERNTMLHTDQKLEEEKELPDTYFRSVNEFQSRISDDNSSTKSKDMAKHLLEPNFSKIDELSSSSDSENSAGSDLDYRQKRQRSMKVMRRLSRKPCLQQDPALYNKIKKASFALSTGQKLDILEETPELTKRHSFM